jgi:hypothetical protein
MRILLFVLGIICGMAAIGARAEARDYPWCATYDMGGSPVNCGFDTFEQCMATVRGIGGSCDQNTQYQPVAASPAKHRVRHKSYADH